MQAKFKSMGSYIRVTLFLNGAKIGTLSVLNEQLAYVRSCIIAEWSEEV